MNQATTSIEDLAVDAPAATRAAILASAIRLFEEQGYDVTSVQQIVDDAGRTKGAFYHYFDSKQELLHEIHDGFIDIHLKLAQEVLARDLPVDELLARFVTEVLMEPLAEYLPQVTIYLHERRFLQGKAFEEVREKRDQFADYLIEVIERGVNEGVFKDMGPARVVAFGIIGMTGWAHTWFSRSGPLSATEIGEIFAKMVVDGLRSDA